MDELYHYDNLNRLTAYELGNLNEDKDEITSGANRDRGEAWGLSPTGNWSDYQIDADGDGYYHNAADLDQTRDHNTVNEITGIDEQSWPPQADWAHPAYDAHGNTTTVPMPQGLSGTWTCVYDAWNRLVEVIDANTTTIARYEYDGLNRRIMKQYDSDRSDGVDAYRHFYYSKRWQVIETRSTDDNEYEPETLNPEYQYVWSLRYIDAPILRDENKNSDGDCTDAGDERIYYLTDANMNVTCLTDEDGGVLERYSYGPYGNVTIYNGDWSQTRSSSSYDNPVLYCGYWRDKETELYHVRMRFYHPDFGRWLQRDDLGSAGVAPGTIKPISRLATYARTMTKMWMFRLGGGDLVALTGELLKTVESGMDLTVPMPTASYLSGMDLYEYSGGTPIAHVDPFGLYEWSWGAFLGYTGGAAAGGAVGGAVVGTWITPAVGTGIGAAAGAIGGAATAAVGYTGGWVGTNIGGWLGFGDDDPPDPNTNTPNPNTDKPKPPEGGAW